MNLTSLPKAESKASRQLSHCPLFGSPGNGKVSEHFVQQTWTKWTEVSAVSMNICLWQVVSRLFHVLSSLCFFFSSWFQLPCCFFSDSFETPCLWAQFCSGWGSWNQKSLWYGGEELFSGIVQPLLPGLYPLEKCGLLDLAAWHVQLMWAGLASAAFIVFNAASICFLSKPLPTNY